MKRVASSAVSRLPSTVSEPSATPCRLFIDPPAEGAWNMAVDEALLDEAADEGLASLRFYQWSEPTLSLGYFQQYDERDQHAASRGAAVVRRLSGGGALVHDRELTYSLCLPATHPFARRAPELYALVHTALIEVLAERGVAAQMQCACASPEAAISTETADVTHAESNEPFLCFARRSPADVVVSMARDGIDGHGVEIHDSHDKIVGSAQRRRRGAVLQHGAVLLATSSRAPELPGIERSGVALLSPDDLIAPWSTRIAERLNLQLSRADSASTKTLHLRNNLLVKHTSHDWLARR